VLLALATSALISLGSTSYCLTGTMADGSQTRPHSVAMNTLPLGTEIRLVKPKTFYGQRRFWVRDRIGHGSEIDFWHGKCSVSRKWGRKNVQIRVVKRPH
jgi:3D (Asp-Asp-Asp) domain-containing protein